MSKSRTVYLVAPLRRPHIVEEYNNEDEAMSSAVAFNLSGEGKQLVMEVSPPGHIVDAAVVEAIKAPASKYSLYRDKAFEAWVRKG